MRAEVDDAAYFEAARAGEPVEHVRALGRHQHDQRKAREREDTRYATGIAFLGGVVVWR